MLSTSHFSHKPAHGWDVQHLDQWLNVLEINLPEERRLRGQRMKTSQVDVCRPITQEKAVMVRVGSEILRGRLLRCRVVLEIVQVVHSLHLIAKLVKLPSLAMLISIAGSLMVPHHSAWQRSRC